MSEAQVSPKPSLCREDIEEQLLSSEQEAKSSYDNYQKALGIVAACRHMLSRFDLPNRPKPETPKVEDAQ